MNNGEIKNVLKYINTSINNNITNNSLIDATTNYLYLGIIFVLIIILIIAIIILCFLLKNKNKVNYVSNSIGLNKIIIKNNYPNIINKNRGFKKVQNTSKVNDLMQQNNNILNEIKTENLENEIHNIIHSSSSSSSSSLGGTGGKRLLRKKKINSNLNTSDSGSIGKVDNILGKVNINKYLTSQGNKENSSEGNTQKLEKELKEQIKKFVIEEHNI